ncbi:MAG: ERAP1-like C-terminal domain-containing protein [Acidobacteria bacterium]|nr:ERAP1-like C-terminal domain-containing protein [Acidobacteriota bacterium]
MAGPSPGVPLDLAARRAAIISDLRYALTVSIPEQLAEPVTGTNIIRFSLTDTSAPLVIDFATTRANVKTLDANGSSAWDFVNGHIVVPAASLKRGENTIAIDFIAGNAPLNRSADFMYTLFVPARAHLAFPVFDQPSLKAKWSLTLDAPEPWQTAANGAVADRRVANGRAVIRFAETAPLPTYLFAFIAGHFTVETAERHGRTFNMFHRETDAAKLARNRDAIFDLHARAIEYMERYTGIPYAFGKFDFVLMPAFQFSGMEHAGKILYNAPGLLLEESATQNQYLGRASVISHETAHMWFGDLVTMQWFDDVWMKEVFANFMAAKIVNPSFPEVNHELRFLLSHYPSAYEVDRTPGANPIRQPLDNLNEAGSLYGAIIYQKAPIVMRHLEHLMGEEAFRDGLREYLHAHAFGNATWTDLIDLLDTRTSVDLKTWSRVWVEEPGRPAIATELAIEKGRIKTLAFRQSDPWMRPVVWPQQLRVTLGYEDRTEEVLVAIEGGRAEAREAAGMPVPLYVLPNGGGWGYGAFTLDPMSLRYVSTSLPDIGDALTRGAAWVTLWENMLDGAVPAPALVDLAMRALPRETDEQLTSRTLGYLRGAWWRFLGLAQREGRQARLEAVLASGLASAETTSQKAAWFNAIRDVALRKETLAWLQRVWEQQEQVPGLPLAEADYASLAQDLAVREVPGWQAILTTQLARMENPDRKARFEFVMPSLSADAAERERWFLALQKVDNRRREPWVLDGLGNLHHPLRAAASAKYVRPSLQMLREIQQTGDIFFPTRWMTATLSGHSSREVAKIVRDFLNTLPAGYPVRLKYIILQTADDLFRATGTLR